MTDSISTEAPVTISIDLDAFAKHILNRGRYGYDEDDEPNFALDPILGEVVTRVTKIVSDLVVKESVKRVSERIDAEIESIVRGVFDGEFQPTDQWGAPKGEKTSLRARIAKQADEWFGATGNTHSFRNSTPNGQKFIAEEVERVVKADCKEALESNRAAIVGRIKDIASSLLAAEAVKR